MLSTKHLLAIPVFLFVMMAPIAASAQQALGDKPTRAEDVVPLTSSSPIGSLLPDKLGGLSATSGLRQVGSDNLAALVGDKAPFYLEYLVVSAVSRDYGRVRVDVFETHSQRAAFGLFTFNGAANSKNPGDLVGSEGAQFDDQLLFFKGRFFVQISDLTHRSFHGVLAGYDPIAQALAAKITPGNPAITRPALLDSLPAPAMVANSQRYFLGPESLNSYMAHAREMFDFAGDTEAVAAEYKQTQSADSKTPSEILKIAIVEYHTPQFATDAMARATGYLSSLPENEQQRLILKRVGNYLVEAVNVRDRAMAESLINSVEYPYTVKWLRNPLWPTNDPFRVQKAAQMLVSTFGLLGLILGTVLVVGTVFGTTIFLKRRKRQQQVFSDAGGMLRLDIDQLETAMLGLPPAREE